jgi:hypothetical protein
MLFKLKKTCARFGLVSNQIFRFSKLKKNLKIKKEVQISFQLLFKKHSKYFKNKALKMFGSDFAVSKSCP